MLPYVEDLRNVIDMDAIRSAGLKLAVDPLGGAAEPYWEPINSVYRTGHRGRELSDRSDLLVHDGRSRRPNPHGLLESVCDGASRRTSRISIDVAFANDPDSDRHGIVTPSAGLMNPNHYLAVAIRYLLTHRPNWPAHVAVGKTLVSSSMIDRVVDKLGRSALRGAGRLQVVRAGIVRRLALFWRRGKCGRKLPAAGRHRVDDRQGRSDHGLAGGRDHRAHGQGSGRATIRN